jgi:hypothetical protein
MEDEVVLACSKHESSEELSQKFGGQPEGKWPLGRNCRTLQNMKINLKEAGNESDRPIILAQGRNKCRVFVTKEIKQTSGYV